MMTPQESIDLLKAGNQRFVHEFMKHERQDADRRKAVLTGQFPFAAILTCSDSRVPPEIIFDQGIGDLFIVRVAGNIFDEATAASLEYAAAHLHVPLIVVLGHTSCGAINATLESNGHAEGHIPCLFDAIQPSIISADADEIASVHARNTAGKLGKDSPVLRELEKRGNLKIVSAMYDLKSGKVGFLE